MRKFFKKKKKKLQAAKSFTVTMSNILTLANEFKIDKNGRKKR